MTFNSFPILVDAAAAIKSEKTKENQKNTKNFPKTFEKVSFSFFFSCRYLDCQFVGVQGISKKSIFGSAKPGTNSEAEAPTPTKKFENFNFFIQAD
jgi:hypothetical protein